MAPLSMLDRGATARSNALPLQLEATAAPGLLANYNLHATRVNDGNFAPNAFSEQRLYR